MRRLTHREYDHALLDLLGDASRPAEAFAPDTQSELFDSMATQHVSVLLAEQYLDSAVQLAEQVKDVRALLGCDPGAANGDSCVRGFITRFGRRAFRRPLDTGELDRLRMLYERTRGASDAATGVRSVLAAVLTSPHFLFRPEFGAGASSLPDAKRLAPFELGARMAALLWASLPDDALLDAAAANELDTPERLANQARRMLDDDRARIGLRAFYEQWLGLSLLSTTSKDSAVYPGFDDGLRGAMAEETRRFVDHVLWEGDAKLSTLLTAPIGFVNGPLARIYGVAGPRDGSSFERVELDPNERSGLLTQASFLTAFAAPDGSSPVKRGKWVRVRMLCQELPEPPANVPPLPPPAEGVSTRERFAMHTASPACAGCHALIDGLGFGLERYDGIGAYRSVDRGVEVDARGKVTATTDIDGPYEGAPELSARLAESEQVRACAPTQWLRYALGRRETEDDGCSLASLQQGFGEADGDLRALMLALVQSDAFTHYRSPE
jgi:Protein of unknown function (DUF1592)/Protein of unknown function (DUF1588)/Protein of unknown function (DUF1595)/Protein of unknown function (DUF1585)/Protein of unknown function (DUF1587)